jgi:hypothetical protein
MESEQLDVTLTGRDEREKEDRNKKSRGKRASSFGLPGRPSECALGREKSGEKQQKLKRELTQQQTEN